MPLKPAEINNILKFIGHPSDQPMTMPRGMMPVWFEDGRIVGDKDEYTLDKIENFLLNRVEQEIRRLDDLQKKAERDMKINNVLKYGGI